MKGSGPRGDRDAKAEALRRFQAAISGLDLAGLTQVAGDLDQLGGRLARAAARPDRRRPPLPGRHVLRVRVDLDDATPPIWRRLDLRSDLTLDVLHQVLQAAFGWSDSHLHRFSLGGGPFHPTAQLFLCPYDVEEDEEEGGIPAADVRLDETLQELGDELVYAYDYGDGWELTLRLEAVRPAMGDTPPAVIIEGARAAPPEDCGGLRDAASLATVLDDPDLFDLDGVNRSLQQPFFVLRELGVDPRLVDLVNRLAHSVVGDDLAVRALALTSAPTRPERDELAAALPGHLWFLDRARGGGIELTAAGYLKPADVEAASLMVPAIGGWIGKNNRESMAIPLLEFRKSLQRAGLLRKHKGALVLTRAGAAAQRDPVVLWGHLCSRLVPAGGGFDTVATLLLLAYAGSSANRELPLTTVAAALTALGWRRSDGQPIEPYSLYRLAAFDVLANVTGRPAALGGRHRISPAAAALATEALRPNA